MERSSVFQASKQFKYLIAQHLLRPSPFERLTCISLGNLSIFGTPWCSSQHQHPPQLSHPPLTAVTPQVSSGHSHHMPEHPCCQRDRWAKEHENSRAFMFYRQLTYSQRGLISPLGFICNIAFYALDH